MMNSKFTASPITSASCSRLSTSDKSIESRIPRRVKSDVSWSNVDSSRTTPNSTVSGCLLSHSCGDGSIDPEVEMWVQIIPLSKSPRNFSRDFSDGVLMAEILAYYFPKRVDLHNYVPASGLGNKRNNWQTLNQKILSKIGAKLSDAHIENIVNARVGSIDRALKMIYRTIENIDRENVETRQRNLSALACSFNGESFLGPFTEEHCLVRGTPGENPDCIIYQNIKYLPSTYFDDGSKMLDCVREKNNELCNKVRRLETMLSLKESHLQDLTSKIHELRKKYEACQKLNLQSEDTQEVD